MQLLPELADKLMKVQRDIDVCPVCNGLKDQTQEMCSYCADQKRDRHMICVVEEYADLLALEQTGAFKGLYHILGGSLSPLHGRGPKELSFEQLFLRLEGVGEVIIATNPNFE